MGFVCRALAVAAWIGFAPVGCTTTGDVLEAIDGTGSGGGGSTSGADGTSTAGSSGSGGVGACGSNGDAWCPELGSTWQVQRVGGLDASVIADIYDVPLFTTDVAAIAGLHGEGRRVVCWFSAGISTWSDPDRDLVLPATGPDIVPGQPERWMDTSSALVRDAMLARLDQAAVLGCDAVEPGDIDGYLVDSGLALTRDGTIEYVAWLADGAHERGLALALSDGNELAGELEPAVDLAIDFGCLAAGSCEQLAPFTAAGKLVLHAELVEASMISEVEQLAVEVCAASEALTLVSIFKKPDLNAWLHPCD